VKRFISWTIKSFTAKDCGYLEATAKKEWAGSTGHEGIDPKASDYRALMNKIKGLNPDLIYFGGITRTMVGS